LQARNINVGSLVLDIPMTYNVILGRPILHQAMALIAPYLLEVQYEADGSSLRKFYGDQRIAWECYLVSIKLLVV